MAMNPAPLFCADDDSPEPEDPEEPEAVDDADPVDAAEFVALLAMLPVLAVKISLPRTHARLYNSRRNTASKDTTRADQ